MWMQYKDVDLLVYDPAKNVWQKKENQTVLATDNFLYAVDAVRFHNALKNAYENCEKFKNAKSKKEKDEAKESCFREMLNACSILKNLRGTVYSGSTLYRIEYPEKIVVAEAEDETETEAEKEK